jgi:hypothetical protein
VDDLILSTEQLGRGLHLLALRALGGRLTILDLGVARLVTGELLVKLLAQIGFACRPGGVGRSVVTGVKRALGCRLGVVAVSGECGIVGVRWHLQRVR